MAHLEHIGIAVADVDAVQALYDLLLEARPYKSETVEREGVRTHFIAAGTAKLELLEALGPDSPVAKYLDKRGQGLHHLAFEVDDAAAMLTRLRDAGYRPLSDEPRTGADGKQIFFLHPKQTHGVLVECCQSVPTALPMTPVPFRQGALASYRCGDPAAPCVVVLHAAGGAMLPDYEALLRRLETKAYAVGLDFEGHGASAFITAPETGLDLYVENVRALLHELGLAQVTLLGDGLGADVALAMAQRHPEAVARLMLYHADVAHAAAGPAPTVPTLLMTSDQQPLASVVALREAWSTASLAVLPGAGTALPSVNPTQLLALLG